MAAAYLFHIAMNHPFVDGNKRSAWLAARLFLRMNGYRLRPRRRGAVRLVESVAAGKVRDWRAISEWLAAGARAA
jgi:death-on-curing protein